MEVRMTRLLPTLRSFGALLALAMGLSAAARGADLSEPVILVASSALAGTPFEQAVVLAAPMPDGGHIGFIINKPTGVKLQALFPEDTAARRVTEPVYLGGPVLMPGVFAVTRKAPEGDGAVIPLMPGLVAVLDGATIDRIIKNTPDEARYFLGLMLWKAGDLEDQVSQNTWELRPADVDTVLRARSPGLWNSLRGTMARLELVRTRLM
jgi:putative transcriptional regulator